MTARQRSIRTPAAAVFLLFAAALGVTRAEASIPRVGDADRRALDGAALASPTETPRPVFRLGATLAPPSLGPSFLHSATAPELALFPLFTPEAAPGAGWKSRYVTEDELGNVTHLTDQSGAVVERYQYEGYGKFRIFDPSNSPRTVSSFGWNRLFQGREHLGFVEAYDFRARVLWPELGRFGQEDPIKAHPDLSLYEALGGNWTGRTDPRGLDWTPQARLQQRELVADLARFKASAGEGLRAIVGAFSRNVGGVYNPADRLAASLPDVANLRYYFEEEVIEDYGVEWSNYVLSHLEDRLQSFSAAWDRAKPQNHDNVYFDEEAGRFALFDREAFETSYGVTGLVSTGFDVFVAAGATGEARRANAGYEVGPAPRLNGNSLENPLDNHVYAIFSPDGLWKIGESSDGVRKRDGMSKRAEKQVRKLGRKFGPGFESEIRQSFPNKASGKAYERRLIQRYSRRFGRPPGNPVDR